MAKCDGVKEDYTSMIDKLDLL